MDSQCPFAARPPRGRLAGMGVFNRRHAPVAWGGFAGAGERVVLRANGRRVASAAAGPLGRYRLRFAPRASGRYRLLVTTATHRRAAGSLVVRPVVVDAVGDVTFGEEVGPAL